MYFSILLAIIILIGIFLDERLYYKEITRECPTETETANPFIVDCIERKKNNV